MMARHASSSISSAGNGVRCVADSDTIPTSVSETSSAASLPMPPAPHPTPANTVAGEMVDARELERLLARMGLNREQQPAPAGRSNPSGAAPAAASRPADDAHPRALSAASKKTDNSSSDAEDLPGAYEQEYPEHSMWANEAEEDVAAALQRLATLARDEHKTRPDKSVSQYYSERLARLIKEGEIPFDVEKLQ